MNSYIKVAIIGATGYTGAELVRLLERHPIAKVSVATSARQAGTRLDQSCAWLNSDLILESFEPDQLDADVAFLCQEAGFAGEHAPRLVDRGIKVVDLSADYRLNIPDEYAEYYGKPHPDPTPKFPVAYGLPELVNHGQIARASLVANPGCYPTASLLGLMPLIKAGWVNGTPVIDAKSGVSGAGRSKAVTEYLFSELTGGFTSYASVKHRHTPEIEQLSGVKVRFTPHLIPSSRGIHATIHVPVNVSPTSEGIEALFRDAYASSPCVRWVSGWPSTKQVQASNRCDIHAEFDPRTGFVVVASVIDNLVKGASGQAIQNMNILFGLDEATGLPLQGVWP